MLQRYALLFLLLMPGKSWSLGLGDATVESLLDYPLRVKIELLAARAEELADLSTKLASPRDFDWVGIERAEVLNQLEFSDPIRDGNSIYFTVTSKAPIREPVLNFLVEAQWAAGRLLREYTIKLQPSDISTIQHSEKNTPQPPEPAAEIKPALGNDSNDTRVQPQAAQNNSHDKVTVHNGNVEGIEESAQQQSYRSVPGDTLSVIARKFLPEPLPDTRANRLRMMIAILEANPNAFIDSNINGLKADARLLIPAHQQVEEINQEQVIAEVKRQNDQWRNKSQRRASPPAQTKDTKPIMESLEPASIPAMPESDGTDKAPETLEPEEGEAMESIPGDGKRGTAPPLNQQNEETDQQSAERTELHIVSEQDSPVEAGNFTIASNEYIANLERSVTLAQELAESRRQESEEIKSRIGRLESVITQQERLITLQNDQLSELNDRLQVLKQPPEAPESNDWLWFTGGVAAALILSLFYLLYTNLGRRKTSITP